MSDEKLLVAQNQLLQQSVDILSQQLAREYQRGRASEYVEARAERIAESITTAIAQFEDFKNKIVEAVHREIETERKLPVMRGKLGAERKLRKHKSKSKKKGKKK